MRNNNMDTYKLIVMNMDEDQKSKLTRIVNQTADIDGSKRVIRKVIGVRAKP